MLDLTAVTAQTGFQPLPAGDYVMSVKNAVMKDTKNGKGQYINAEFVVAEGEYKGQKVFQMFNTKNENEKAVQIGLGMLKSLLKSANFPDPNKLESVTQLAGLRCSVSVKVETDDYGTKNKIVGFKPATKFDELTTSKPGPDFF